MSNKQGRKPGRSMTEMKPKILKPDPDNNNKRPNSHPVYSVINSQEFVNRSIVQNPTKPSGDAPTPIVYKEMRVCLDLLNSNIVLPDVQEFLRDNSYFRVIAVLGRGQQKERVLNSLLDKHPVTFSSSRVQIFITKDRHFLLNVNLGTKSRFSGREGDVDLLMLYITLLKLSHTMIFVEPLGELLNCIRMLRCAELLDFGYKLGFNLEFTPNLIIVLPDEGAKNPRLSSLIENLFKGSRLQDNVQLIEKCHSENLKLAYRCTRVPMSLQPPPFTELHWFQLLQSLWKQHKTNYFLVKYAKTDSFQ